MNDEPDALLISQLRHANSLLQARLKLDEQVFRVQVVKAPAVPPAPKKEEDHGHAE